jgi:hypothetical protein
MKKFLLYLNNTIGLIAIGLLIGLYIQPNEIGRYQLQNMFNNSGTSSITIPKALIDTKTGDVWILVIKNGPEWKQIRNHEAKTNKGKGWAF